MRNKAKHLLECFGTLLLFTVGLLCLSNVCQRKDSITKYADFFAQKEDFDVFLLGNSIVDYGILPIELWNRQGIVSYNLATPGSYLPATYWVTKMALQYKKPKLAVINCASMTWDSKTNNTYEETHDTLDAFPLTLCKLQAVLDLLDADEIQRITATQNGNGEKPTPMGLLWPFSVYHSRWSTLSQEDITPAPNPEKGALPLVNIRYPDLWEENAPPAAERPQQEPVGMRYLKRLIEELQQEDIDILLTYLPYSKSAALQMESGLAKDIAEEYNLWYLDLYNGNTIDAAYDCADGLAHVNISGARKLTAELGAYIREHYNIVPDRRGEAQYAGWYDASAAAEEYNVRRMQSQKQLWMYLLFLTDARYDVVLLADQSPLLEDAKFASLWQAVGVPADALRADEKLLIVCPTDSRAEVFSVSDTGLYDTPLGQATVAQNTLQWKDEAFSMEQWSGGVLVLVQDHATGAIIDAAAFQKDATIVPR